MAKCERREKCKKELWVHFTKYLDCKEEIGGGRRRELYTSSYKPAPRKTI
jgi:hypothetical protein